MIVTRGLGAPGGLLVTFGLGTFVIGGFRDILRLVLHLTRLRSFKLER